MRIGTVVGAPFLALNDKIGRRGVNFLGNFLVICAALMQALAPNLSCFMAGRFFLGFGSALMSSPQYIAEIAPVHLRGRIVGLFGACFQIGSVAMNAGMIGTTKMAESETNNWSWRLPLLLQAFFPLVVCSLIYFITPESPRYYILRGQRENARRVIAKYQTTSGSLDEPIVDIVTAQIEESLETSRTGFRQSWNFAVFVTKTVRYRLLVLILYSMFQSWNGGGMFVRTKMHRDADCCRHCVVLLDACAQDSRRHQTHYATWRQSGSDCDLLRVHRDRRMVCRLLQTSYAHLCRPDRYCVHADGGHHNLMAVQREGIQRDLGSDHNVDVHVPGHQRTVHCNDVSPGVKQAGPVADQCHLGTTSTLSRSCLCLSVPRVWVFMVSSKAHAALSKRMVSRSVFPRWATKSGACTSCTTCFS
jgi:hypothetical protein